MKDQLKATLKMCTRIHFLLSLFFLSPFCTKAFSNQRSPLASLPVLSSKTAISSSTKSPVEYEFALLFDCDGVILETEELHRKAYNSAFDKACVKIVSSRKLSGNSNLAISEDPCVWSVEYYDVLQNSIGGGKPKMRHYFKGVLDSLNNSSNDGQDVDLIDVKIVAFNDQETLEIYPSYLDTREGIEKLDVLIDKLQASKTQLYKETVEENAQVRPGVLELIDEALESKSIALGVCSASTKGSALKVLDVCLGAKRVQSLNVCILGDDVSEKKPSPMIYNEARKRLGIKDSRKCAVIEDSAVGLRAAKSANMRCIITYTDSTATEDFYELGADAKVSSLRCNSGQVTLDSIFDPMKNGNWENEPELLVDIRDGIDSFESIPEPVTLNTNTGSVTPITEHASFSLQSDDEEYDENAAANSTESSPPAQRNKSRRLRLYEDDMGNFSMERPYQLTQI